MSEGRVTYAYEAGWNVLRYFGRVDYTMAPAIERFVDALGHDVPHPFLFDLSGARLLDSTNLGLMARVVERSRTDGASRSAILSPPDDIDDVIRSMGFEHIADITSVTPFATPAEAAEQEVVTDEAASQGEMLRTMLEAHRALTGLDDQHCAQWRDVVTMLEAEMRSR
jgi:anti-anti-sigma regulatory factor